jgi:hypothetical protein
MQRVYIRTLFRCIKTMRKLILGGRLGLLNLPWNLG